jgi:hypothetical protein
MVTILKWIIIILLLIISVSYFTDIKEGIRNRRGGHRRHHGRRPRHNRERHFHRNGGYHYGNRGGGGGGGYYGGFVRPTYINRDNSWYNSWYNPFFLYRNYCKKGCVNLGNDEWGCQYPGYGANDCLFSGDCRGC